MDNIKIKTISEQKKILIEDYENLVKKEKERGYVEFWELFTGLYLFPTQKTSKFYEVQFRKCLGFKKAKDIGDYIDENGRLIEFKYTSIRNSDSKLRSIQIRVNQNSLHEYIFAELNTIEECIRIFRIPAHETHELAKKYGSMSHNKNDNEYALTFDDKLYKLIAHHRDESFEDKIYKGKCSIKDLAKMDKYFI